MLADPKSESRLPLLSLDFYVPRDEQFTRIKFSEYLAYTLKFIAQITLPGIASLCNEFNSFEEVHRIYEGGIKLPKVTLLRKVKERIPWAMIKELVRSDGEQFLKFPMPDVIKGKRIF